MAPAEDDRGGDPQKAARTIALARSVDCLLIVREEPPRLNKTN